MHGEEVLLEVSHVSKIFPVKKQQLRAVLDVSFTLEKGELLGIVGESGCGKSTLAKMLVGSLPVTSGTMKLSGEEYTKLKGKEKQAFRRKIQMVFQDPLSSFSPRMKIGTYLAEPRRNFDHVPKQQALAEAEKLLEKVGLPRDFAVRYPHELSGGQLQRVAIARAIAISPGLLICDEATGALDVSVQNQIAQLLVNLIEEQNMGCIFIGHDLALVRSVTQRIAVMYLGRIVEKKMTELGNSLMHGDISIKPYEYEGRKPCEYCEFKNICAYEDGVDQVEKIKKVSLEEGKHALDQTTAESH